MLHRAPPFLCSACLNFIANGDLTSCYIKQWRYHHVPSTCIRDIHSSASFDRRVSLSSIKCHDLPASWKMTYNHSLFIHPTEFWCQSHPSLNVVVHDIVVIIANLDLPANVGATLCSRTSFAFVESTIYWLVEPHNLTCGQRYELYLKGIIYAT